MLTRLLLWMFPPTPMVDADRKPSEPKPRGQGLRSALMRLASLGAKPEPYVYPIAAPQLMAGVVPAGSSTAVAMDSAAYQYANTFGGTGGGFPGYPYLANLATRAEYRAFASALSTEMTREWIELTSSSDDDDSKADKIKAIEAELTRIDMRGVMQRLVEHDCYYGRAQVLFKLRGAELADPLLLSKRTVVKGSFEGVKAVEAIWTTPKTYNAQDPSAPDFYQPSAWYMLGNEVHASRLMTVVTRPLPDILKPAFNFGGMSLSQLAEPYVDNWLRTRQSVADLINNFSITALATSMDQVLQGDDESATDLFNRAKLFTMTRSNQGLMLLDKDREELVQVNTPLSGLHELQAQSQEHMCSVSRTPAIVLTGISPSGLNASSDGEIRVFYDWIAAQQEAHWRAPIKTAIDIIQLSLFGDIDPDIGFKFVPLYQMTAKEEAEIRLSDANAAAIYIDHSVLDPSEVRERLAQDPDSGYMGLDLGVEIVPPAETVDEDGAA